MTATPSDKRCAEPPQRRAVELPEIVGYMWPYKSSFQMTVDKGKAGIAAQIGYSVSDLCTVTSAIAYAEQVAAERVREACYGLECLLGVEAAERKTVEAELAAEKQRADSLESKIACTLGVGDGSGRLFVYGDYESIKAAQERLDRADSLAVRVRELEGFFNGMTFDRYEVGPELSWLFDGKSKLYVMDKDTRKALKAILAESEGKGE